MTSAAMRGVWNAYTVFIPRLDLGHHRNLGHSFASQSHDSFGLATSVRGWGVLHPIRCPAPSPAKVAGASPSCLISVHHKSMENLLQSNPAKYDSIRCYLYSWFILWARAMSAAARSICPPAAWGCATLPGPELCCAGALNAPGTAGLPPPPGGVGAAGFGFEPGLGGMTGLGLLIAGGGPRELGREEAGLLAPDPWPERRPLSAALSACAGLDTGAAGTARGATGGGGGGAAGCSISLR